MAGASKAWIRAMEKAAEKERNQDEDDTHWAGQGRPMLEDKAYARGREDMLAEVLKEVKAERGRHMDSDEAAYRHFAGLTLRALATKLRRLGKVKP